MGVPDLSQSVVVITGASVGLGAAMARWFANEGAAVAVCARRLPPDPGGTSLSRSVDVTDSEAVNEFARQVSESLGPADLWVNNAAVLDPIIPQRELEWADLADHLEVNVGGVLNGTNAFLAELARTGHSGGLVNISSGLAQKGRAGLTAYSVAKAGVERMTEIAIAENPDSLRLALAVSPGVIETQMQQTLRQQDSNVLHDVAMFRGLDEDDKMYRPEWVAETIATWVFGDVDPGGVVVRVPPED